MISRIKFLTPILTLPLLTTPSAAQKLKKADKAVISNLEIHVRYLSDDRLEGRRTGTAGEKTASDYITSEFGKIGLKPKGNGSGWLQAFDIDDRQGQGTGRRDRLDGFAVDVGKGRAQSLVPANHFG